MTPDPHPCAPEQTVLSASVRRFRAWLLLLATVFPIILTGCSILLVSPYDETTDRAASELVLRTETFLSRYAAVTDHSGSTVVAGKPYDSAAGEFYDGARGAAAAMLVRSSQKAKNSEEIQILTNLGPQYARLEKSHRLGLITQTSASGLRRSLRALSHIQLVKKRIGTTGAASSPSP